MPTSNNTVLTNSELKKLDKEILRLDALIGADDKKGQSHYGQLIYVLSKYYEHCDCNEKRYRSSVSLEHVDQKNQRLAKAAGITAYTYGITNGCASVSKEIPITIKGLTALSKLYPKPTNSVERQEIVRKLQTRLKHTKFLTAPDIEAIPGPRKEDDHEVPTISAALISMVNNLDKLFQGQRRGKLDELIKFKEYLSVKETDDLIQALEDVIQSAQGYRSRL